MGLNRRQIIIEPLIKRRERRRKVEAMKTKRVWVRQLYTEGKGEYRSLIKEMQIFDEMLFNQQFRMMGQKYENLLTLVAPRITKSLVKSEAISLRERLPITCSFTEQVSFVVSELFHTHTLLFLLFNNSFYLTLVPTRKFPPSSS